MKEICIAQLDKAKYKGFILQFSYWTDSYYEIVRDYGELFSIKLVKRPFANPMEKHFMGTLYEDSLEKPTAYSIGTDEIAGYLEVARESWNNRLRVTELLILEPFRGKGFGSKLITKAKEIAFTEGFREVILETQSCNTRAIDFYLKNAFTINGIDLSSYSVEDIENKEVRLELVCRQ
jgi:ribosomal protein S18 acetylase RimI-like enzyme